MKKLVVILALCLSPSQYDDTRILVSHLGDRW